MPRSFAGSWREPQELGMFSRSIGHVLGLARQNDAACSFTVCPGRFMIEIRLPPRRERDRGGEANGRITVAQRFLTSGKRQPNYGW